MHALSQQKPSTQLPVEHSAAAMHAVPFCFLHVPLGVSAQLLPAPQSAFSQQTPSVQNRPLGHDAVDVHVAPTPARGTHFSVATSQNSVVAQSVSPVHAAHLPVGWHLPVAHTVPLEHAEPIGRVPTHPVPALSQTIGEAHVAVQQRLPSFVVAHVPAPVAHALSAVHGEPVVSLALQTPPSQNEVEMQSASLAQLDLHPLVSTH